jgi:release factor glutamine methyltransferase
MARQRPTSQVLASDVSPDALAVARENAYRLGAYNVAFLESDLFAKLRPESRFDVVTANPPYIATEEIDGLMADVRDFEPRLALDGGPDGLEIVRRIVDGAPAFLEPGGVLAMEIGAGEAAATRALLEQRGYHDVQVDRDYGKIERVVSGVRPRDQAVSSRPA